MRKFPCEYLYIDEYGKTWYKTYLCKKKRCDINPYTLAGIPVIFSNKLTLNTLINLVYHDKTLNKICFYSKEFYEECQKTSSNPFNGNICFYWADVYENDPEIIKNSSPKMEVDRIDNDGLRYGIELTNVKDIKDCIIKVDNSVKINNKNDIVKSIVQVNPTLFEVIYGLYWELSFLGKPEEREERVQEIYDGLEE